MLTCIGIQIVTCLERVQPAKTPVTLRQMNLVAAEVTRRILCERIVSASLPRRLRNGPLILC